MMDVFQTFCSRKIAVDSSPSVAAPLPSSELRSSKDSLGMDDENSQIIVKINTTTINNNNKYLLE